MNAGVRLSDLPAQARAILELSPGAEINSAGFFELAGVGQVPLAETLWNQENRLPWHRLSPDRRWGIVLHWYGDKDNFDRTLTGYLRGFNSLRWVGNYQTRTSAHFLVGPALPAPLSSEPGIGQPIAEETDLAGIPIPIGIIQTQLPSKDGHPVLASHLQDPDYEAHKTKAQYFVRALYELGYADSGVHSMLQDWFDGRHVDPNEETIAIEITGHDFETAPWQPPEQQVANTLSVIWAIMQRYQISAMNLLGHQEIILHNPDPGKKFLARVRFLLGLKALLARDPLMEELVFGTFRDSHNHPEPARYFRFVRNYLALTAFPRVVWEWEKDVQYWNVTEPLFSPGEKTARFVYPLLPYEGSLAGFGSTYLEPTNHEGVDLVLRDNAQARLVEEGTCLLAGDSHGDHRGKQAFFRHVSPDGAELITIYKNLVSVEGLQAGKRYPKGHPLGKVEKSRSQNILHFACAYGAAWLTDLAKTPDVALNCGATWIRRRFMDPMPYVQPEAPGLPW